MLQQEFGAEMQQEEMKQMLASNWADQKYWLHARQDSRNENSKQKDRKDF
jgi:uncharacterized protein YqgQ